jgi:ATP-dependent DNA helicase MPH1
MCYRKLKEAVEAPKSGKSTGLAKDQNVKSALEALERQMTTGDCVHPKMDKLLSILLEHFVTPTPVPQDTGQEGGQGAEQGAGKQPNVSTRAMIFSSNRAAVEEIVNFLSTHHPLLKPTKFVGQGTDGEGGRGMSQKEQIEVRRSAQRCVHSDSCHPGHPEV